MATKFLSINQALDFYAVNPDIKIALEKVVQEAIKLKRSSFLKKDFANEFDSLKQFELVIETVQGHFRLNFDSLAVCQTISDVAVELMNEGIPADPESALDFGDRFALEIRKPKTNHYWYNSLEIQFESFLLVFLHQTRSVDLIDFYNSISRQKKEENPGLRSLDLYLPYIVPYLQDDDEKIYGFLVKSMVGKNLNDAVRETLLAFGKINPARASQFYHYCKEHTATNPQGFLSYLLVSLYNQNQEFYLNEAIALFQLNQMEGLAAIAWFEYTNTDEITKTFQFVNSKTFSEIDLVRQLPAFFTRLIANANTSEDLRTECFHEIKKLTTNQDVQLRNDLVFRTRLIKGYDDQKYYLLPDFMSWGEPNILREYFSNFSSPQYLFELLNESYKVHGLYFNLDLLKDAVFEQHSRHQEEFDRELLLMLASDLPIIRFGGIQILTSMPRGVYPVNFLQLDEPGQLKILDFVLPLPVNIEELLPLCLVLRNSPFEKVKSNLENQLNKLVWAYDYHLLDMLRANLDLANAVDKNLFDVAERTYLIYKSEKEIREKLKEFDPLQNELQHLELYFRLEHEQQIEAIEKAQGKSVFAQIAKNISVIRGSGFNTENNRNISVMGTVGVSRLVDQRYSINPDKFEWNYQMQATKNI